MMKERRNFMIDLSTLVKKKLEEAYQIPVEILSLIEGRKGLHFQVIKKQLYSPDQEKILGFDVVVQSQRIEMFMLWNEPLIDSPLPEIWKAELMKSQQAFHVFWSQLVEKHMSLSLFVNGRDVSLSKALSPDLTWQSVDIKAVCTSVAMVDDTHSLSDFAVQSIVFYWGLVLSLLGTDTTLPSSCCDGKVTTKEVNVYERNPLNRKACIALKGTTCAVCGLNFEKKYGPVGAGFIEIHHRKPVSQYDGEQLVNPLTDLVPVCANCHAMLHRRNPPYSVEELKEMIQKACKS